MKATFKTESIPIDKLLPNPKNPRIDLRPGMPLYEKLKDSIVHHDYAEPIIWNKQTGYIVSGHQRLQVMKDLAEEKNDPLTEVEVVVVDMPENKADTLMVAVNKITGLWDTEKLSALFEQLSDEDLHYTGYDDFEIQALLDNDTTTLTNDFFEETDDDGTQVKPRTKTVTCPHCGKEFEVN
jgi:hypothetical protein